MKSFKEFLREFLELQPLAQPMVDSPLGDEMAGAAIPDRYSGDSRPSGIPPRDPGKMPQRGPDETDIEYRRRIEEYLRLKKAYDKYKEICPSGNCRHIFTYPNPKHPLEKKDWETNDTYIGPDGKVFTRNNDGKWIERQPMS